MNMNSSAHRPSLAKLLAALTLVGLLAGLTGCVAVAAGAGAGAVAYVRGDLEVTLSDEYEAVVKASREALKDLEFIKVGESKDALKAVITARTAMDKKIEITVANLGKTTNVKIRVGVFGDEQISMSILDKIKANL